MSQSAHDKASPGLRWLSRDYVELRRRRETVFDVLIVGSGYGGAMAAAELAGRDVVEADGTRRPARICVLERGKEYVPGMFASSLQELPPHLRVRRANQGGTVGALDALLDVRLGPDVCTLTGNGLGGGSLINAGVMATPRLDDCKRLPPALAQDLDEGFFREVREQLGATDRLAQDHPHARNLAKTRALRELAEGAGKGARFGPAAITVQVSADANDRDMSPCTLCGDCMTGCNAGAKKSLDTTLLRQAWLRGVDIYTGGSVLKVKKAGGPHGGWTVRTVYTDEGLRRRHLPVEIKARRVILAAGTLGSTEILMRSRNPDLQFSPRLGEQFSCNGDNLVALHDGPDVADTTAEEWEPLDARRVGPTITSTLDLQGVLVQEFAVPAPLKRLFDETVTTSRLLQDLAQEPSASRGGADGCDSFGVDPQAMRRTLLVGLIGHDEGSGQLRLDGGRQSADGMHYEGTASVHWPGAGNSFLMEQRYAELKRLVEGVRKDKAHVLPNPLWRLLPDDMDFLVKGQRGPLLTVHPLGGCPMGASALEGVVDDCGRVYDAAPGKLAHEGLVVLDGSIIPGSLGANPALTIAAVAKRAAGRLALEWALVPPALALPGPVLANTLRRRPRMRPLEECTPPKPVPTEVQLTERLAGRCGKYLLELTLAYHPRRASELMAGDRPQLEVDRGRSFLRVYSGRTGRRDLATRLRTASEAQRDEAALVVARVHGTLDMLRQDLDTGWWPRIKAIGSWVRNRGSREFWDWAKARLTKQPATERPALELGQLWRSAARAAEARCFDYRVDVCEVVKGAGSTLLRPGDVLAGSKRLTYGRFANPWRQLTEVRLLTAPWRLLPWWSLPFKLLPRWFWIPHPDPVLQLDGRFLARQGYPLLRITRQENQVVALAELASWGMAWVRMLLSIHLWSFRAPDTAPVPRRRLLPAEEATRLPAPEIRELELEPPRQGVPVRLRLTRYRGPGTPIALVHGYSASGTTFTHDAIRKPLALFLHEKGYDVWVLDLRTSAGMPSAVLPWHFEDAALADLPLAIATIRAETGQKVDVVAHCIGAVMLSMALLADADDLSQFDAIDTADGGPRPRRRVEELRALRDNVHAIVLSQKAPMLAYSDGNVLRAYFMRAMRRVVLPEDFQFTVPDGAKLASSVLDRVLSTMPYPDDEFRRENPFWRPWKRTPWAGFRHRMDALYARDFKLSNIPGTTLRSIHDLFGTMNLDTVSQAIHFARLNTITDAGGRAIDTQGHRLIARWPQNGTLHVHGMENGLADIATQGLFRQHMRRVGLRTEFHPVRGYGHQDCLIGRHAERDVFKRIHQFLEKSHAQSQVPVADTPARARPDDDGAGLDGRLGAGVWRYGVGLARSLAEDAGRWLGGRRA